jgi:predicted ferric reductase
MFPKIKTYLILNSIFITIIIWLGSKWFFGDVFSDVWKYPAKVASLSATILFCWSMILSARVGRVNRFFGGLDKVYWIHAFCGAGGFFLILLHPIFLSFHNLPSVLVTLGFFWFQPQTSLYSAGHNLGIFTLLTLTLLVFVSGYKKIPYHIWKQTHNWMTLWFLLPIIHIFLVDADIAVYPLLSVWMYAWLGLALWCGVYIRFVYPYFGPRYEYEVKDIEYFEDSSEIWLKPIGKFLKHQPGQYVYARFELPFFSQEIHPFSIASGLQEDGCLKFGIKNLGDFTSNMGTLQVGNNVTLFGPYGLTHQKLLQGNRDCVMIGGGVGVTPFVGMWDYALGNEKAPKTTLMYSVKNLVDATFDNDIQKTILRAKFETQSNVENHNYVPYDVSKNGYLTVEKIMETVPNLKECYIFLCGPKPMTDGLISQLQAIGVKQSQIVLEEFEMRPSLGSLFGWK